MAGLGTIINGVSIIAGGFIGHFAGKFFKAEQQDSLNKACGVSILFIGIAGAMEGMLKADGAVISSGKSMLVVLCIALGTIIGELIGIEQAFERFGEWLKIKTGSSGDIGFVNAFYSLPNCVHRCYGYCGSYSGRSAGDYSTLAVKSVLDFIIIAVMTSSMGKGAVFSAIPVVVFEGCITLLARLVAPVMTDTAVAYLSLIGSVLIFCIGINLVWGKKLSVANMLPAVFLAVGAAYLPINF